MSLPAATGLAFACSPPRIANDPNKVEVLADKDLRRYDLAQGAWSIDYAEPTKSDLPSCPDGNFCVVGTRAGSQGKAPAPFDTCAAQVPFPREPIPDDRPPGGPAWVGGPDVNDTSAHFQIRFSDTWTVHERKAKDPSACCYSWVEPCPGGRPLRDIEGNAIVAPVTTEARSWRTHAGQSHVRDEVRARRWLRAAQLEHASVASFARFSLELLALGAPAHLVARAHRAALDEIEHAKLAFVLAAAFGGEVLGPGALPITTQSCDITPEEVARSTFRDGCVAETIAALEARRDLADARSAMERGALERIADDEEGHAELAFATLAWLVATFGDPVRVVLAQELARIELAGRPDADAPEETVIVPCVRALLAA